MASEDEFNILQKLFRGPQKFLIFIEVSLIYFLFWTDVVTFQEESIPALPEVPTFQPQDQSGDY